MMKKVLKILGGLAAGGLAIGLVWYFQALKIDGDPLLTACWPVDIYDDVTGEKVVGAEDLDFDPATGTIFLSAYDRRAVAREIDAGKVTTQGGIYTFQVSDITEASTLQVTDITRGFKEAGNEFRPHGFTFIHFFVDGIVVINRRFQPENRTEFLVPTIEIFQFSDGEGIFMETFINAEFCDLYDILPGPRAFLITDFTGKCEDPVFATDGVLKQIEDDIPETILTGLAFPNGLAITESSNGPLLAVALTRGKAIQLFDLENYAPKGEIKLEGAPDNLTVDENENLFVTIFPNLIDYFYYMKGWFGVKKSPSVAYRILPKTYEQQLLFKDDGEMISGATVALRAGDYLILGSGWDDHIAICSGMDRLD